MFFCILWIWNFTHNALFLCTWTSLQILLVLVEDQNHHVYRHLGSWGLPRIWPPLRTLPIPPFLCFFVFLFLSPCFIFPSLSFSLSSFLSLFLYLFISLSFSFLLSFYLSRSPSSSLSLFYLFLCLSISLFLSISLLSLFPEIYIYHIYIYIYIYLATDPNFSPKFASRTWFSPVSCKKKPKIWANLLRFFDVFQRFVGIRTLFLSGGETILFGNAVFVWILQCFPVLYHQNWGNVKM